MMCVCSLSKCCAIVHERILVKRPDRILALLAILAFSPWPALAVDNAIVDVPAAGEKPTPYDTQLARLAEILGTVHYLRNLCDQGEEPEWRETMQSLLESETADEPGRRSVLTAAFNRGYRSFAAIHVECTPAAVDVERRYRIEGATLATEIAARFGN